MSMRYPVVLTTVEEDFRRIGILPQRPLMEVDDPTKPREIPSPDPSTMKGLDDSQGDKSSHTFASKQPKPKMGPDEDDAEDSGYDPLEDGGSKGSQKGGKGAYHKVAGGKEASLKGEGKEYGPKTKAPYKKSKKNVHPKGGDSVKVAQGLKPTKKIAGMKAEGTFRKAASLIEEVEGLLRGVQTNEETDNLLRSFRLVSENAALLADRLTEVSHIYETEEMIGGLEELSRDAADAYEAIESEIASGNDDGDEAAAIANSGYVGSDHAEDKETTGDDSYEVPSPAPGTMEQAETVLKHMVVSLMDALESYDGALDDMGYGDAGPMDAYEGDGEDDDDQHGHDEPDDDDNGGEPDGDDDDQGDDDHDDDEHGHGGGESFADRMAKLRSARAQMGGGGPQGNFRGGEQD